MNAPAGDVMHLPPKGCSPPRGFRAAEGVRSAWAVGDGPFGRTPEVSKKADRRTAAQRAGLRYEKKVKALLAESLGEEFRPGQWFRFTDNGEAVRFCQVDGLLVRGPMATIFEVKYTFTSDAWWQLRRLYEPVVRRAFYCEAIRLCVVCRVFDPMVPFPEETELLIGEAALRAWVARANVARMGVFSWRGK